MQPPGRLAAQEGHAVAVEHRHLVHRIRPAGFQLVQVHLHRHHGDHLVAVVDGRGHEVARAAGGHADAVEAAKAAGHRVQEIRPKAEIQAQVAFRGLPVAGGQRAPVAVHQVQGGRARLPVHLLQVAVDAVGQRRVVGPLGQQGQLRVEGHGGGQVLKTRHRVAQAQRMHLQALPRGLAQGRQLARLDPGADGGDQRRHPHQQRQRHERTHPRTTAAGALGGRGQGHAPISPSSTPAVRLAHGASAPPSPSPSVRA